MIRKLKRKVEVKPKKVSTLKRVVKVIERVKPKKTSKLKYKKVVENVEENKPDIRDYIKSLHFYELRTMAKSWGIDTAWMIMNDILEAVLNKVEEETNKLQKEK